MRKITLVLMASAGLAAGMAPAIGAAAQGGPDGVTVSKDGVTIDTHIQCVTEPCPSKVVVPLPTGGQ